MEFIILAILSLIGYVLYKVFTHCEHDYEFLYLQLEKNRKYTQVTRCRKCGKIEITKA